jgi:glycerol kinase
MTGRAKGGGARGPFVLAIDQGTTGSTVLVLDRRARVAGRGYAELPQHYPRPGWVEHDGTEMWETTLRALHGALGRAGLRGARASQAIVAIGITNQRETTLLWDRRSGRPIARAIVWQDRRTADRCAALRRAGEESTIARATGLRLDPYFSGTKIEWLLRHVPRARARARRGALAFGTVDAWMLWNLTGGRVHATDPTNASRTLLFHLRRRTWDGELLARFDVPRSLLPEVRPSVGEFGVTRHVPGLRDGLPILGIAGDQQAALFGQGCVRAGGMKNTYGTGCFLMLHTGSRPIRSKAGLITTVACGPRGEAAYALEGSIFVAGAAIQWLRDGLGILPDAAASEAVARSVPDSGETYLVPAFAGLGAPHWEPDARGLWCGLTRGTTRAHLVRAALESISYQTMEVVGAMRRESGVRPRVLRDDGGATANDFLMQFQADLLGMTIERPAMVESTGLGAGLLAGIGAGVWDRREAVPAAAARTTRFLPRLDARERRRLARGWDAAVNLLTRA